MQTWKKIICRVAESRGCVDSYARKRHARTIQSAVAALRLQTKPCFHPEGRFACCVGQAFQHYRRK